MKVNFYENFTKISGIKKNSALQFSLVLCPFVIIQGKTSAMWGAMWFSRHIPCDLAGIFLHYSDVDQRLEVSHNIHYDNHSANEWSIWYWDPKQKVTFPCKGKRLNCLSPGSVAGAYTGYASSCRVPVSRKQCSQVSGRECFWTG